MVSPAAARTEDNAKPSHAADSRAEKRPPFRPFSARESQKSNWSPHLQGTAWFGAFAVCALLLGAEGQSSRIPEADMAPLVVHGWTGSGMPESARRPDAGETEEVASRAEDTVPDSRSLVVSAGDLEVLARIVNGECPADTPFEGKVAVAAVVLNRVRSKRFAMSIPEVAHQAKQFSCYNPSSRARLYGAPVPPAAWEAARAAVAGEDPTCGCTFFFNPYLVQPGWARQLEFVKRIGTEPGNTHAFYRAKEGR